MTGSGPALRITAAPLVAAVLIALLLTGCASARKPAPVEVAGSSAPTGQSQPAAVDAPCRAAGCRPGAPQSLGSDYTARLWSSPAPGTQQPATGADSTPVVELLRGGTHIQWWIGRLGFGWAATLRCLPGSSTSAAAAGTAVVPVLPNCFVLAEVGSHAGSAEALLLRHGELTTPARASVVFDSGAPVASDLDGDGWLDVVGVENDFRPSYATGHNFWTSYRLDGGTLRQTGCRPVASRTERAPTRFVIGKCPVIGQA